MIRRLGPGRASLLVIGLLALVAAIAIPALAASPSPSPGANPGKGPKASEAPAVAVTLHGVVGAMKDADGDTTYSLSVDGTSVQLDAGPPWFYGDNHPLAAFVGKSVTITGSRRGAEVDVETVDGVMLREPGKPPWAGGWKAVGSAHPGWSQAKADRSQQKQADKQAGGVAGCWPPGHCKQNEPESSANPDLR
ncbi:MAG TPA: hypothetical protein VHM48_09390 [Candidatus Limnocylindrales bacterium]|nr:hypothetical protein [Candidatus Limnocylindrales bacterium]